MSINKSFNTRMGPALRNIGLGVRHSQMTPQEADNFADMTLLSAAKDMPEIAAYVSEEQEELVWVGGSGGRGMDDVPSGETVLVLAVDPLDGTSNVDADVTVGTIYCVYEMEVRSRRLLRVVTSGYCIYGFATLWVRCRGEAAGLEVLRLHERGHFVKERVITAAGTGKMYCVNHSYEYEAKVESLISCFKRAGYAFRWVGCLIADVHQIIARGGVYMYPATSTHTSGKIRLVYEAIPVAYILAQVGGAGLDCQGLDLVDSLGGIVLEGKACHARSPVFLCTSEAAATVRKALS